MKTSANSFRLPAALCGFSTNAQNSLVRPCKPPLEIAASPPNFISTLEVERKFLPSAFLREQLHATQDHRPYFVLGVPQDSPHLPLTFLRQPDHSIRDIYFDHHGQLMAKGLYIRRRISRIINDGSSNMVFTSAAVKDDMEAKIRVSGDFTNSKFIEVQGREAVVSVLRKFTTELQLEALEVDADLETIRQGWLVKDVSNALHSGCKLHLVLDSVTSGDAGLEDMEGFEHQVGEVEMVVEVVGGEDVEEHERIRNHAGINVDAFLARFMASHAGLFPVLPKPVGKLSAYFAYRKGDRAGR